MIQGVTPPLHISREILDERRRLMASSMVSAAYQQNDFVNDVIVDRNNNDENVINQNLADGAEPSTVLSLSKPVVMTPVPAASQRTSETPAASQRTSKTPAASQHTSKTPAASQHTSKTPAASQHTSKTPAASQHTSKTPAASQHTGLTWQHWMPDVNVPKASKLKSQLNKMAEKESFQGKFRKMIHVTVQNSPITKAYRHSVVSQGLDRGRTLDFGVVDNFARQIARRRGVRYSFELPHILHYAMNTKDKTLLAEERRDLNVRRLLECNIQFKTAVVHVGKEDGHYVVVAIDNNLHRVTVWDSMNQGHAYGRPLASRLTRISQITDPSVVYTSHAPEVAQQLAANGAPGGLDCGVHATLNFEYLIRGLNVPTVVENRVIIGRRLLMCHEFLNQVYDPDWNRGEPTKLVETKPPVVHRISNDTTDNNNVSQLPVLLTDHFERSRRDKAFKPSTDAVLSNQSRETIKDDKSVTGGGTGRRHPDQITSTSALSVVNEQQPPTHTVSNVLRLCLRLPPRAQPSQSSGPVFVTKNTASKTLQK